MSQIGVSNGTKPASRLPSLKLDASLFNPSRQELEFFMNQTKIEDEGELKEHILAVQREAWDVVNFRCIQVFEFTRLRISRILAYRDLLKLGRERPDAIFIDYACCFGNDARKAVADGYPIENVVASDLRQEFWDLGHKLFRSTPETFTVPFIQGNVFDPQHIAPTSPLYSPPTTPRPDLSSLTSLTSLQGHVSAIHASQFFHLFTKEDQIKAARALASLLSPLPGSMIFGTHATLAKSKEIAHPASAGGFSVYNFSPEDWCALWDGEVFQKGSVVVEAELKEPRTWSGLDYNELKRRSFDWCIKRI